MRIDTNISKIISEAPFFWIRYNDDCSVEKGGTDICYLRDTALEEECVFWKWDGERLLVKNDRLGFYPLYYAFVDEKFSVSNSIIKLLDLGVPRDFDFEALSVFFRIGFFTGEDTPFKNIKTLPPGATFIFEKGRLQKESQGYLKQKKILSSSYEKIVDQHQELVAQSIARRLPRDNESFALPLSGGRDSRHILFELRKQGHMPKQCLTIAKLFSSKDMDVEIASNICKKLNIPLDIVDSSNRRIQNDLECFYKTDFCSDEHGWANMLVDRINDSIKYVYDGIGIDIILHTLNINEKIKKMCELKDWPGLIDCILKLWESNRSANSFFSKGFNKQIDLDIAREKIKNELILHEDAEDPYSSFLFWNRTRREISLAPFKLFGEKFNIHTPFLDLDLLKFIFSLPKNILHLNRLRDDAISKAYPEFLKIPYSDMCASGSLEYKYSFDCIKKILKCSFLDGCFSKRDLVPRLLRMLIDKRYLKGSGWLINLRFIYLCELMQLCRKMK